MKHTSLKQKAVCGLAAALLLINSVAAAAPRTTTLGTRALHSQDNTAVTSSANVHWSTYSRAANYPRAVTLPLQFITTSAGDKLAVLVSVPADLAGRPTAGQFPVVLTQTSYRVDLGTVLGSILPEENSLVVGGLDKFMVRRGYISVAVDVLGAGMSTGVTELIGEREQQAYAEAVNWVTLQPWSNGKIGLAGSSYLGVTSLLTAAQQHPAVKAVFTEVPLGDPYRATVAPGGMLNMNFLGTWATLTQNLAVSNELAQLQYPQYAAQIKKATQQHIAAIDQWFLPTVNNFIGGKAGYATDDGNFWSLRSPLESARNIKVPTFIIGGSNDIFQRDEPLLYEQLKHRVNTKLLILPGAHVQTILKSLTSHDNWIHKGAPDAASLMLQWFDQYLKGMNTGAESMPNVTQFVQGHPAGERYVSATDWPHPKMTPMRMHLRGDMRLSVQPPASEEASHTVAEPATPAKASISRSSDGKRLAISLKTNDGSDCSSSAVQWSLGLAGLLPLPCHSNNATVNAAQKALVYSTPALSASMYLNGPIQADIWMSASHARAAITVRLEDVDLLGRARPISAGIQSAVHRAVDPARSRYVHGVMMQPWHPFTVNAMLPLNPNQPVLVSVEILPTAALIKPGHRLQIAISASDQVRGVWSSEDQALAAGNVTRIHNSPAHPSSIVLPVVPATEAAVWH